MSRGARWHAHTGRSRDRRQGKTLPARTSIMPLKFTAFRTASLRGSRMNARWRLRSLSETRTREHVLQMHCSTAMVVLKNPMWYTGSTRSM